MTTRPLFCTLLRTLLRALLYSGLAGCVGISTRQATTLPEAPAAPAALPVPVAFIVHLELRDDPRAQHFGEPPGFYSRREAPAWATALSAFAAPEHILIAGSAGQPDMTPEFAEFCRTHPVVDITPVWDREAATIPRRIAFVGSLLVDITTLGLVPLPAHSPHRADFRLTLPGATAGAAPHDVNYAFERKQTLAPFYVIPIPQGDDYSLLLVPPCSGCGATLLFQEDRTDWRIEEKRRLLAQFVRDIRPQLTQYARDAQAGAAPSAR